MKKIFILFTILIIFALSACGIEETTRIVTQTQIATQTETLTQFQTQTIISTALAGTQTVTNTISSTVTLPPTTTSSTVTLPPNTITITPPTTTITFTKTTIPPIPSPVYEITEDISYKVTQKTSSYWYFSWKITIKNLHYEEIEFYMEVHFLDSSGYSLEWTNDIVSISPNEEKTILGQKMIGTEIAGNVVETFVDIDLY